MNNDIEGKCKQKGVRLTDQRKLIAHVMSESENQYSENMKNSKTNLYLFQFSFLYGNEIYLPYSVGALWAYARTFPEINKHIEKKNFVILR